MSLCERNPTSQVSVLEVHFIFHEGLLRHLPAPLNLRPPFLPAVSRSKSSSRHHPIHAAVPGLAHDRRHSNVHVCTEDQLCSSWRTGCWKVIYLPKATRSASKGSLGNIGIDPNQDIDSLIADLCIADISTISSLLPLLWWNPCKQFYALNTFHHPLLHFQRAWRMSAALLNGYFPVYVARICFSPGVMYCQLASLKANPCVT